MYKKGQAAMEFLMTYGWAILVVLVAIGALAYFGVLNPSRFLPETCTLTPGLACNDFNADIDSINMVVQNGIGEAVTFTKFNVTGIASVGCTAETPTIVDGGSSSIEVACSGLTSGSRLKGSVEGTYTKGSGTLAHSFTGSIVTQVP